jgi:hypothetical protein
VARRFLVALLAACPLLSAQQSDSNPQELFQKVRRAVAAAVESAPRYTCVESVERTWYRNRQPVQTGCRAEPLTPTRQDLLVTEQDRLRLDVGVSGSDEIYAWHGESQFKTEDIGRLVPNGPISSGMFFSLIADIFVNGGGHYYYKGLRRVNDTDSAVFDYLMPRAVSHYSAETSKKREVIGYRGSFTADPVTGELQTLQVKSDEMPKEFQACGIDTFTSYQSIRVNGKPVRIPQFVRTTYESLTHDPTMTSIHYSGCHEFVGESVIHFDSVSDGTLPSSAESAKIRSLPAKLRLKVRLDSPIDSEHTWTGDPVRATLVNAIATKSGAVIAPQNALLTGRVVQLDHYFGRNSHWDLLLRLDRIHTGSGDLAVVLKPLSRVHPPTVRAGQLLPDGLEVNVFDSKLRPGVGGFQFSGDHLKLDSRFVSDWETVTSARE